jgi:hypothetical protein
MVREFSMAYSRTSSNTRKEDPAQRYIIFLKDRSVRMTHLSQNKDPVSGDRIYEVYDVNNGLIEQTTTPTTSTLAYAQYRGFSHDRRNMTTRSKATLEFSDTLDMPVVKNQSISEIWRYNIREQQFTGYDASGHKLGYFGKLGFQDTLNQDNRLGDFQGFQAGVPRTRASLVLFWLTSSQFYEIDFEARHIKCWVDNPEEPISTVGMLNMQEFEERRYGDESPDPDIYRPLIVCKTNGSKSYLILYDTKEIIQVQEPAGQHPLIQDYTQYSATDKGIFASRHWTNYPKPDKTLYQDTAVYQQWVDTYNKTCKEHCGALYRIDMQGQLTQVSKASWTESMPRGDYGIRFAGSGWSSSRALSSVSPGLYCVNFLLSRSYTLRLFNMINQRAGIIPFWIFPQARLDLLITSSLCLLLAWLHLKPREGSRVKLVLWLMFVLCFNLAGLLTYLALNHTPLVRCASCGKKRGLTSEACVRCQTPLPLPEHTRPHLLLS